MPRNLRKDAAASAMYLLQDDPERAYRQLCDRHTLTLKDGEPTFELKDSREGALRTHCHWESLEEAIRDMPLFDGIIRENSKFTRLVFTTIDGEEIEVPPGARLELHLE